MFDTDEKLAVAIFIAGIGLGMGSYYIVRRYIDRPVEAREG